MTNEKSNVMPDEGPRPNRSLTITVTNVDPYGDVVAHIRSLLYFGFDEKGGMSDGEYENLKTIEEVVRRIDKA